jgi:hypothetical protein
MTTLHSDYRPAETTEIAENYAPVDVPVAPMAWVQVFVIGLVGLAGVFVGVGALAGLPTFLWAAGACGVLLMALILIDEQRPASAYEVAEGDGLFMCGCGEVIEREAVELFDELAVCPRCHAQMTAYRARVRAADQRIGNGNEAA